MRSLLPLVLLAVLSALPTLVAGQIAAAAAYAPSFSECPVDFSLVRETSNTSQTLSAGEAAYVSERAERVLPTAWQTYLSSVEYSTGSVTSLPEYVSDILQGRQGSAGYPKFALATSGGGYRAAIFGAGVLNALDARNFSSVEAGTGGLLQAATYLAGLSGGSWLLGSLYSADFPTLPHVVFGPPDASSKSFGGWNAQFDLISPVDNTTLIDDYLLELVLETTGKALAGYPVNFADMWARALSRHFVNGTSADNFFDNDLKHGAGVTFSSLVNLPSFVQHVGPFPIIVADSPSPHANLSNEVPGEVVPLTNVIYEFTPYEFGSYDPGLSAFTPTQYLGSYNGSICTTGYDQLSFVEATSSMVFNELISEELNKSASALENSPIYTLIEILEDVIPEQGIPVLNAQLTNAFYGVAPSTYIDAHETVLTLTDGGDDGEGIPIQPLLVHARGIDTILAIDASADTDDHWAAGRSIIATQDRAAFYPSSYSFPPVPTTSSTFIAQNLSAHPTFFGCEQSSPYEPLVIYLANGAPPVGQVGVTNTSTVQIAYEALQIDAMLTQTFDIATQGRPVGAEEKDSEWPACLACAVVDRARVRAGIERTGVCASCMERYCWS